jgi:lysophospholipid acyltransferase (LPLAT)-like uncharacterized protein
MNLAGRLGAGTLRAIMATANVRELVEDPEWHPSMDGQSKSFLLALWHENLLVGGWAIGRFPNLHTLASDSDDGEIAAGIASSFGMEVLRGSSSRGGVKALKQIVDFARNRRDFSFVMTPDGPRGPRREMKGGLSYVASRCRMPIVCLGVACERGWRMNSWDRMQIPRPFRRVQLYYTAPVFPGADLCRKGLDDFSLFVESEVGRAQSQAEHMLARPCAKQRRTSLTAIS